MIGQDKTGLRGSTAQVWLAALLSATLSAVGCAKGTTDLGGSGGTGATGTTTTSSASGSTTTDTGSGTGSCKQDCSTIPTQTCMMAVCNEGQHEGPIGACVVVDAPAGTACDDGQFCTVADACDGQGTCLGTVQNDCGLSPPECTQVTCDELSKTCDMAPADNGVTCAPTDPCQVNGTCKNGKCVGEPKDCSFSPLSECNAMTCNPATGACEGTPDASKNGTPCALSGDLCHVNRVCTDGACAGGSPKDCSSLTVGCNNGECNPTNGACTAKPVPAGGACFDGIDQCHVGACDASSTCVATALEDGTPCNDSNPCTIDDVCTAGVCGGTASSGCQLYLTQGFEACPAGWSLSGDWQCGVPSSVGPSQAHGGHNVLATQLASNYSGSQEYASCHADSPSLDLTAAHNPQLSFWAWVDTEGSSYDGFNLQVSTDGGSFAVVTGVTPAYSLTIGGETAWGGHQASSGWQNFVADLTPYAGHQAVVRFAFQSDSIVNYPGVYIDDVLVAEPSAIQLAITSKSISDAVAGQPYAGKVTRSGGSSQAAWSIIGGKNSAWLTIDPTTGALSGTPGAADVGSASVAIEVQEVAVPGNVAIKTFDFNVVSAVYYQGFEGACPGGFTLGGDWQCGAPTSGPGAAFSGTNVIATQLAGDYNDSQSWDTATATSPAIDLTAAQHPALAFRMWVDTEGSTYDGANLKISTDGGATYSLVNNVVPAYNLTSVGGQPAWGGHQASSGWQLVTADLAAYAGHTVRLRFAFRSDSIGSYPGVYIDDVMVSDH